MDQLREALAMQVPKLWDFLQNVSAVLVHSLSFHGNRTFIFLHIVGQINFSKASLANSFNQSKPFIDILIRFLHLYDYKAAIIHKLTIFNKE